MFLHLLTRTGQGRLNHKQTLQPSTWACPGAQVSQQIVETEHLFKALLEQPNGLARRIVAKAGSNPTELLEKTDAFIRRQPRVTGDSQQARRCYRPTWPVHFAVMSLPLPLGRARKHDMLWAHLHQPAVQSLCVFPFSERGRRSALCMTRLHCCSCLEPIL